MKEVEFERKVKEKDAEIEMKKAELDELDKHSKEKDAELERQAKIIQEMRQTNEVVKNKRLDLIEHKMDLMESKINKILDLMNKS